MTSIIDYRLNCYDHLISNLNVFIDAFAKYYGEEERQNIESSFRNAIIVPYLTPEGLSSLIAKKKKEISEEIKREYEPQLPSDISLKDLFYNHPFSLFKSTPIGCYELLKNVSDNPGTFYTKRIFDTAKPLLKKFYPDITEENFGSVFKSFNLTPLDNLLEIAQKMLEQFGERMKPYQQFSDEIAENEKAKRNARKMAHLNFIQDNIDLVPREELELLKKYTEGEIASLPTDSYLYYIFGVDLSKESPIDYFSPAAENHLLSTKTAAYKVEKTKNTRIEFFKRNGIDLGDNYDAYLESEAAKKIWPSTERTTAFQKSRRRWKNSFNNYYYKNSRVFQRIRERLDSLGFEGKYTGLDASLFVDKGTPGCVTEILLEGPEGYQLKPIVFINCGSLDGELDHYIVHELNHVYETALQEINYPAYNTICGWDECTGTVSADSEEVETISLDRIPRESEVINETVNEEIAQEISKIMQEEGMHVFDTEENAKYKNTTSYEHYFFVIEEFFQEFKEEILRSRRNNNKRYLLDVIGKENYNDLKGLLEEVRILFPDAASIVTLNKSISGGEENDDTSLFKFFKFRKIEILEKIREHKKQYQSSNGGQKK